MSDTPRTDSEWRHYVREGYRDAGQSFARTLERELAATQHLLHESLQREDRFYRDYRQTHAELRAKDAEIERLREAANAVVERWETPLWKDVEPTAHVIYALRDELAAQQQASK